MKRIAVAVAGAVALTGSVAGLTACSNTPAPVAGAAGKAPVPVSCSQRYQAWNNGPGKGLIATFDAIGVAGTAGDPKVLTLALEKARPAIAQAGRNPVPACADPRGFWTVLLMHVNAAASASTSTRSPASMRAAMKDVPGIERQLTAELKGFIAD